MYFCIAATFLCAAQILIMVADLNLWAKLMGEDKGSIISSDGSSCSGAKCFEVWSCTGLKDASQNLRVPLLPISGLIFFPFGALGCLHGDRWYLSIGGRYLFILSLVNAGMIIFDCIFSVSCPMYSTNIIKETLIARGLPPSPVSLAAMDTLRTMTVFEKEAVDEAIGSFQLLLWYIAVAGAWTLLLFFVCSQVLLLSELVERGPLGLGVNYGLNQWDEVLNHDAIRIHQAKHVRSKFLDDATLPLASSVDARSGKGYPIRATEETEWASKVEQPFGGYAGHLVPEFPEQAKLGPQDEEGNHLAYSMDAVDAYKQEAAMGRPEAQYEPAQTGAPVASWEEHGQSSPFEEDRMRSYPGAGMPQRQQVQYGSV
eukprot:CAMPEP_0170582330 /NCGR_PEP_ID=MMETSP0224-20130122/7525_1 /TAXON_ID=285029 /ORGANISM="Togula jolla, Strain CCCM 725" /LENGTH=370 /DNA_ID=CAMNT_0010905545 /DNA_START=140 /DNA_END=1252 /DNA_ORIENTATION=-